MVASNPPKKCVWKRMAKAAVREHWNRQLKAEASGKPSLKHINLDMCQLGYIHPVLVCGNDPMQAIMTATKAMLLVGRYPLSARKCASRKQPPECPMCLSGPETMTHFLLQFQQLQEHRVPYLCSC